VQGALEVVPGVHEVRRSALGPGTYRLE